MSRRARRWPGVIATAVLTCGSLLAGGAVATPLAGSAPAATAPGTTAAANLPGGTSIDVTITTPPSAASFASGPVTVAGTASVGTGAPVADTALIYVLDVSGSTSSTNGCGGNQNSRHDDESNTVLDCEIASARALNTEAAQLGTIRDAGVVVFGEGAEAADVQPANDFQLITTPAADGGGDAGPDIEQVLSEVAYGAVHQFTPLLEVGEGSTNFADAIRQATRVAAASTNRRKVVIFLSDGMANTGDHVDLPLRVLPSDVDIFTFAVGGGAQCDADGGRRGSLRHIANSARGSCTPVPDPSALPDILPGVIASQLTALTMQIDNLPAVPVTGVTPALPQRGPVAVSFVARTPALAPGDHTACVTASGSDGGGAGGVTACHQFTVNPDSGPQATTIAVTIDTPPDGAALLIGPATVTGTASIGPGRDLSDAAIIYVLDVSSSTDFPEVAGCGGDQNADGRANRVLDCEIAAAKALNERVALGGALTEVGAAAFGDSAITADVSPATGEQFITGPATDSDERAGSDIDVVLSSMFSQEFGTGGIGAFTRREVAGGTNFADGISKAMTVAGASGKARRIVVFLSDGQATAGGAIAGPLREVPENVDFFTFAVGTGSSCGTTGANGEGSLQDIADATGGSCTPVPDVGSLPALVPGVITSALTSLSLGVDGLAPVPVTEVTPAIPQDGPVQVGYRTTTPDLPAGMHTLCVTAGGMEHGTAVSVTACHVVTVKQPAITVDPPIGPPGLVVRAVGTDFPPGSRLQLTWSVGISATPGEVTVGADGTFDGQVLIFHGDLLGLRELSAEPVSGPPFPAVTSQPFLVVPRALQPPSFQARH